MSYPPPPGGQPYPSFPQGSGAPSGPVRLRGRTPLRLALIFFVLAVVAFVIGGVIIANKSLGKVNSFERVSIASGGGTVTLDGTGKWIGYYEASNVSNSISQIPSFSVQILDPSGKPVTFQKYGNRSDGNVTKLVYDYNGHKGAAAFQFNAAAKGSYRIEARADQTLPSDAGIAVGRDIATGTVLGAVLIGGGVLLLIAALILLIIGLVKRSRHKRELRDGPPQGYPQGPPAGYPTGYPQGSPPPYPQGSPPPYPQGPQQGYGQGPQQGFQQGPQQGFGQGPQQGFQQGPQQGFQQGPATGAPSNPPGSGQQSGQGSQQGFGPDWGAKKQDDD